MYYTWQNLTWLFFHKLSLNQNSSKKEYYEKFINTFKVIIPCSICRNHFLEMLNNDKNNIKRNVKQNNLFSNNSIVWTEGMSDWSEASNILDLKDILNTKTPSSGPPPPPPSKK